MPWIKEPLQRTRAELQNYDLREHLRPVNDVSPVT